MVAATGAFVVEQTLFGALFEEPLAAPRLPPPHRDAATQTPAGRTSCQRTLRPRVQRPPRQSLSHLRKLVAASTRCFTAQCHEASAPLCIFPLPQDASARASQLQEFVARQAHSAAHLAEVHERFLTDSRETALPNDLLANLDGALAHSHDEAIAALQRPLEYIACSEVGDLRTAIDRTISHLLRDRESADSDTLKEFRGQIRELHFAAEKIESLLQAIQRTFPRIDYFQRLEACRAQLDRDSKALDALPREPPRSGWFPSITIRLWGEPQPHTPMNNRLRGIALNRLYGISLNAAWHAVFDVTARGFSASTIAIGAVSYGIGSLAAYFIGDRAAALPVIRRLPSRQRLFATNLIPMAIALTTGIVARRALNSTLART